MVVRDAHGQLELCRHCGLTVRKCPSCGALILWAISTRGKKWPLDATVTTLAVYTEKQATLEGKVELRWATMEGHVPHHLTCENPPGGR